MQTLRGWRENPALGVSVVRIVMGIILVVAGTEKWLGPLPFGGGKGLPLWPLFGWEVPAQEFLGGLLILVGYKARWVALLSICEFLTTALVLKLPAAPPFGGYESARVDFMMLAAAVTLVISGSGLLSVDELLRRRARTRTVEPTVRLAGAAGLST